MFDVSWDETVALGARHGLEAVFQASQPSLSSGNWQAGVTWTRGALRRPG